MKVLVTGATGYIGRRVVKQLVEQVADVRVLTLNRDVNKAQRLMPYANCKHCCALDKQAILDFEPDVVLHLATLSTSSDATDIIEPIIQSNITYGVQLLDVLSQLKNRDFLFVNVGSFAEYRLGVERGQKDAYLYTATKSAFRHFLDFYADKCGFRYITAVPYTVYGGQDTAKKLMDYMIESAESTEPVKMTAGEQVLDFIHVDDVAQFFVDVVKNPSALPCADYHLGTGVGTKVRDLAVMFENILHKKLNIEWGGRDYRPLDVMYAVAPHSDLLAQLWQPRITLAEGVRKQIEYITNK